MPRTLEPKSLLWAKRLRQFDSSSLTVAQFCDSVGCSIQSFYQWRRKLATATPLSKPASDSTSFLQLQSRSDCFIQLKLPSGIVVIIPAEAVDLIPQILERVA